MDKITLDRIEKAHPIIREKLKAHYLECNNKLPIGVRLRFSHVLRTFKEQDELFAKRPKVTNAKGGQSIHNYGLAFDYVVLLDKDKNGTFETVEWNLKSPYHKVVVDFFKSKGYEWGGDWKSFKDYPHFQAKKKDGLSHNWKELKVKLDKKDTFIDNGVEYVNL